MCMQQLSYLFSCEAVTDIQVGSVVALPLVNACLMLCVLPGWLLDPGWQPAHQAPGHSGAATGTGQGENCTHT